MTFIKFQEGVYINPQWIVSLKHKKADVPTDDTLEVLVATNVGYGGPNPITFKGFEAREWVDTLVKNEIRRGRNG